MDSKDLPLIKGDFRLEILNRSHIDGVVEMMTIAFCDDEPMTRYIDMPYEGFRPFAEIITNKAAQDGLSVVALQGERVIACTIVEDIADPAPLDPATLHPKFHYILGYLEQLSRAFFNGKTFAPNHLAHLFITAVDKDFRGLGISRAVNLKTHQVVADRHYDFICCEFTNYLNERGTVKYLPYDKLLIGTCLYNEFVLEGEMPFPTLASGTNAYLWSLYPDAKLRYIEDGVECAEPLTSMRLGV